MIVGRRDALKMVAGGFAVAAVCGRSDAAPISGMPSMTKRLPSFELQGTPASLASLETDIAAYSIVRAGAAAFAVWLKGRNGRVRYIGVDRREPLPMFEVFTLAIATMDELETRWKNWTPPELPSDMPEPFRTLATTRPAAPAPPLDLERWPFDRWRTEVLRRAEFIVEGVPVGATVGANPNMQSAARPMTVPPEASASCEVAAGLLFTADDGKRLLMGVDWMPEKMVVTQEAAKIDEYLQPCERVELTTYLRRLPKQA